MSSIAEVHHAWRALPLSTVGDIVGQGTCLVLAPHPDDESLGCGGLIAACVEQGRPPLVVVLTDGAGSHPGSRAFPPERLRAVRARELLEAVGHLGVAADRVAFLNMPDTEAPVRGPAFDAVVTTVRTLAERDPNCGAILAPWQHDPHCDHEAAAMVAAAVAADSPLRHVAYPVWGWTLPETTEAPMPVNGFRLDVSRHMKAKRAAIQAHRSQYGALITDDPTAFQLPATLLSVFDTPFETFLTP